MSYTKKDVKEFDELLTQSELSGFNNYRRNIARLELQKFLSKFTKKEKEEMAKKIGAYRK